MLPFVERRNPMIRKCIIVLLFTILCGCSDGVSKEEYGSLSKKYDTLLHENSQAIIDRTMLLQRNDELQKEYSGLHKKYLVLKNMSEIIEYEKLLDVFDKEERIRAAKSYTVLENSENNLLFDYYDNGMFIFGMTVIEGYYTKIKRTWFEDAEIEFDSFVITGGEKIYLDSITKRQLAENGIYDINEEDGNPAAHIKLHLLNEDLQNLVKNSNQDKRVRMKIFIVQPFGSGGNSSYPIEILDVFPEYHHETI